jgi:hypothetical protein
MSSEVLGEKLHDQISGGRREHSASCGNICKSRVIVLPVSRSTLVEAYYTNTAIRSARVALFRYTAFLKYQATHHSPDADIQPTKCPPELADAITSITDMVTRFIMTGTANYLPLSAIACTALPQVLLVLNMHLSATSAEKSRHEHLLWFYSEMNKLGDLRYGVTFLNDCTHQLIKVFDSSRTGLRSTPSSSIITRRTHSTELRSSYSDILGFYPAIYLRLTAIMDFAFSTGETFIEDSKLLSFSTANENESLMHNNRPLAQESSSLPVKNPRMTRTSEMEFKADSNAFNFTCSEQCQKSSAVGPGSLLEQREPSTIQVENEQEHSVRMYSAHSRSGGNEECRKRTSQLEDEDILIGFQLFGE